MGINDHVITRTCFSTLNEFHPITYTYEWQLPRYRFLNMVCSTVTICAKFPECMSWLITTRLPQDPDPPFFLSNEYNAGHFHVNNTSQRRQKCLHSSLRYQHLTGRRQFSITSDGVVAIRSYHGRLWRQQIGFSYSVVNLVKAPFVQFKYFTMFPL